MFAFLKDMSEKEFARDYINAHLLLRNGIFLNFLKLQNIVIDLRKVIGFKFHKQR